MSPASMERLFRIMVDVLDVPREVLSSTLTAEDVPDWDSLRTIHLAGALESEFRLRLTAEEIAGLSSVPEIVSILAARGVT